MVSLTAKSLSSRAQSAGSVGQSRGSWQKMSRRCRPTRDTLDAMVKEIADAGGTAIAILVAAEATIDAFCMIDVLEESGDRARRFA